VARTRFDEELKAGIRDAINDVDSGIRALLKGYELQGGEPNEQEKEECNEGK
jgi:hypothetical protein